MKLSINPHIRGKPGRDTAVDLGYNWETIETEWSDIFELITVDGFATSAALANDNRKEANFVSRQLLMVDIDAGMTIPELFDHAFYTEYGAGFYATPSFTPELHKFRICFVLETAETDSNRLRKINRGLLRVFGAADAACKDPTRLFYGTPNCELCERTDKLLPNWLAQELVAIIEADDAATAAEMIGSGTVPELNDKQKQKILELLKQTFVGSYPIWRNTGWGLKAGGFSLKDFQYVTGGMMRQKTAQDAATVWADGGTGGGVTMGSVIHLLKERHGEHCLKNIDNINRRQKYQLERIEYVKQMAEVKEIEQYLKELQNGSEY